MPKAIYKHTKEQHRKIGLANSIALKGRKLPQETKDKISKAGMGNTHGFQKGNKINLGRYQSPEKIAKCKMRKGCRGGGWKGDKAITPLMKRIRSSVQYSIWRLGVFTKDNFTCQDCKKRGIYLEAHHKKPFAILAKRATQSFPLLKPYDAIMIYSPLWDIFNGISYCKKCHSKNDKHRNL